MKLTSNAGHSASSPGAGHGKRKEHVLARRINKVFIERAKARGVVCIDSTSNADSPSKVLSEQVSKANANRADIAISHHLNAGGGTGIEVFYDAGSAKGRALAEKVAEALSKHYGLRNRGAKPDTSARAGSLYWTSKTAMPAILIEWGFIDSDIDMDKIFEDITGGCDAVLDALGVKKATKDKVETKLVEPKPVTLTHLLKVGDTGADVKKLQSALKKLGYKDRFGKPLVVDGIFGANTRHALVSFQRNKKLRADGLYGKNTAAKLALS